jgi:hypothetical protein
LYPLRKTPYFGRWVKVIQSVHVADEGDNKQSRSGCQGIADGLKVGAASALFFTESSLLASFSGRG